MAEHGGSLLPDGRWGPAARGSAEDLCRFHLKPRVPVGCGLARADLARCPPASDPPPRYTDCVDASSIRRFVDRPWGLLRAAKRRYWAEEVAARGADAPLRASRALWLHMRRLRPDWPSDAERAADLAHHLELKGCLDRAARALARLPDRLATRRGPRGARAPGNSLVPLRRPGRHPLRRRAPDRRRRHHSRPRPASGRRRPGGPGGSTLRATR